MTFGERLKIFRTTNNMSQQNLAEKLNVTSQAVSKWENNISEPEFQIINKITDIFKITYDQLFTDNDKGRYKGHIKTVSKDNRMKAVYAFFSYFFSFLFLSFIVIAIYTYSLEELTLHFPIAFGIAGIITGGFLFHFSRLGEIYSNSPNNILEVYGDRVIIMRNNTIIQANDITSYSIKKYNILDDIGCLKVITESKEIKIRNIQGITDLQKLLSEIQYMNTKGEKL
jgi:transcriptional regulator with XRE-family HTH domain